MNKVPQGSAAPVKPVANLKGGVVPAPKAKKLSPIKVGSTYSASKK